MPLSGGSRQRTKTPLVESSRVVVCTAALRVAKRMGKTTGTRDILPSILLDHLATGGGRMRSGDHAVGGEVSHPAQFREGFLVIERPAVHPRQLRAAQLDGGVGEHLGRSPFLGRSQL